MHWGRWWAFGGAFFVAIATSEIGKLAAGETKVDILVTPLVTIGVGATLAALCAPPLGKLAMQTGTVIMWATELQPFLMGILVSVFVGIALTLPISSAAICAALGLTGLAGGAAVAGCSAQMIGFAVQSYRENGVGGRQHLKVLAHPCCRCPTSLGTRASGLGPSLLLP